MYSVQYMWVRQKSMHSSTVCAVMSQYSCTSAPIFQLWSWQDLTSRHSSGISYTRYSSSSWWSKSKIHDGILGEMERLWQYRVEKAICRTKTCNCMRTWGYIRCNRWYLLNISNRVSNAGFFYQIFYPLGGFGRYLFSE